MAAAPFDRSVLKVGQIFTMGLPLIAFILGFVFQNPYAWILVALEAAIMLAGRYNQDWALPRQLYLRVLKPRGLVKPRVVEEDAAPHQFAQLLGGIFLAAATLAFVINLVLAGWVLSWIVILLAFLNFAFDFCVGCQVYFQLQRFHLIPQRG